MKNAAHHTNPNTWPDGTPRSQGNAFDWRSRAAMGIDSIFAQDGRMCTSLYNEYRNQYLVIDRVSQALTWPEWRDRRLASGRPIAGNFGEAILRNTAEGKQGGFHSAGGTLYGLSAKSDAQIAIKKAQDQRQRQTDIAKATARAAGASETQKSGQRPHWLGHPAVTP